MGCMHGSLGLQCRQHDPAQIRFRLQTREVVEEHLKSFSTKNSEREGLIRKWLTEAGCKGENLSEQALDRKFPPNVICVLPGETQEAIVIGAHTDHVDDYGDGVVDNWTGAALLPALPLQPERPSARRITRSSSSDSRRKKSGWLARVITWIISPVNSARASTAW